MHATLVLATLAMLGDPRTSAPEVGTSEPTKLDHVRVPENDTELHWYWEDGLRFETADQQYRFRFGGRFHFDMGWFSGDQLRSAGFSLEDGTEFRRARLYVSGELPGGYFFKTEYDFAGSISDTDNRPAFTDVFVGKKDLVRDMDLQVGHFKEPFGLEQQTGANYLSFVERASSDALTPKRNDGMMLSDNLPGGYGSWAVGAFRANTDNAGFSSGDGGYAVTARATAAPVHHEEGAKVLHVGAAYSMRDMEGARFRSRPEAHLLGNFVDTGTLVNDDVDLCGFELAGVLGPFSAQAEYVQASTSGGMEVDLDGWYVEASWFLTGEHRPYSRSRGTFGRVRPNHATDDGGMGAWQVAARLSSLDLDDDGLMGGRLDDVTLGINWHLTPNSRLMFDYVLANVDDSSVPVDDDASIFVIRLQTDW